MLSSHPFDRYAPLTDLQQLLEYSSRPLRKSVRVNTLKSTVEDFKGRAAARGWQLTPVPWCREGFFVERENREEALGKDLLHLVGHFYMQEAASMLPAALLDPQPGEAVLDLSAAPGSKTTQMAAAMQGQGVVIANDVQEKRLGTLKSALHRAGATSVIVTKKTGQWFGHHMAERFDRVLCDAPCTAQGTARKDTEALQYCSTDNIATMAKLQVSLLASAIHAAKVGGRIVYSTCTLTPEENEGVVGEILKMFEGKVEVVHPSEAMTNVKFQMSKAIDDSRMVQQMLLTSHVSFLTSQPLLRLWPQTYDTEGFFCAVMHKTASTGDVERMRWIEFQEEPLRKRKKEEIGAQLHARYGTSFLHPGDRLYRKDDTLLLTTGEVAAFDMPLQDYALGLPLGKLLKDGKVLLGHEMATLRGHEATSGVWDADDNSIRALREAKDADCPPELHGHVIIRSEGVPIGLGLAREGRVKNNLPRWMVRFG